MLKLKSVFFSVIAAGILMSLSSVSANAQFSMDPANVRQFTNSPCSSPYISYVLKDELMRKGISTSPSGGIDCYAGNYAHYNRWSSYQQLWDDLVAYRTLLQRQHITMLTPVRGIRGEISQAVKMDGRDILAFQYGPANGGAAAKVAAGNAFASPTITNYSLQEFAGVFRGVKDPDDIVVQFPAKWFKLTPNPYNKGDKPAYSNDLPPPPGGRPRIGTNDDSILTCINSPNGVLRQIRAADGGANHISLTVSSFTAYFTGNVLTQSYKDLLTTAARNCGARAVNTNNLRVGR